MFFAGAAAVMTFALASCGGAAVEGTWVEPIPGMAGEQGFTLEKGGRAESVNMAPSNMRHGAVRVIVWC